jgi:hypothetical protein
MALHKHSFGACPIDGMDIDANRVVATHIDLVLHGLLQRDAKDAPRKGKQGS